MSKTYEAAPSCYGGEGEILNLLAALGARTLRKNRKGKVFGVLAESPSGSLISVKKSPSLARWGFFVLYNQFRRHDEKVKKIKGF